MNTPKLELYFFPQCPYCQMVLQEIQKLNLKVEMKNIFEKDEYEQQLLKDTGRRTVPCLYIDGNPKHESADIVEWLNQNLDSLEKN